jgi:hypothetical protein
MIESTGEKLTEAERIEAGIKHCRAEIKKHTEMLHMLQRKRLVLRRIELGYSDVSPYWSGCVRQRD